MKRILSLIIAISLASAGLFPAARALQIPTVSAKAAVVINGLTRQVIYAKNKDQKLSMASTTKIMTSLLLIESGRLDENYSVPREAIVEGSSIGLKSGDIISGRTLLSGMMLESGNDAATATALMLSGNLDSFADMMNKKAAELGMVNSHFVTPSGLDAEAHYSSAYDMALLTASALEYQEFRDVSAIVKETVKFGNPQKEHTFYNHNKLLSEYDGAIGVKTGYTRKSGRCLVSAALRDGKLIIAVTLSDPNDWEDHKKLLDFGMNEIELCDITYSGGDLDVPVVGSDISLVKIAIPRRKAGLSDDEIEYISCKIELEGFLYAPISAGEVVGKVHYFYKNIPIATDNLYVGGDIDYTEQTDEGANSFLRCFKLLFSFYK